LKKERVDLLIKNANEIVTLAGWSKRPAVGFQMRNLGVITNGSIAIQNDKIVAVGKTSEIEKKIYGEETIDAAGKTVTPGFVDPHTHLVFAGSREDEFEMRIKGASYMEILQKGGGILKTVQKTRRASEEQLVKSCKKTLDIMLRHGTTTVEAKSGYGLTLEDELKCLKVIQRLNREHPIAVVPTFLGAHAIPIEYQTNPDEYVKLITYEMIPAVAERKLAEFCDVFCEKGVFTIEQSRRILTSGKKYGLKPKIHADEFIPFGGAELAAEIGAISAEHLLHSSEKGLKKLAAHGVIAILLPAAAFALTTKKYADAKKMMEIGVPIALGTDFNPVCWMESQQLVIALACRQMKMTPAEALTASTINAAHAINRAREVGSLEPGKKADILILDVPSHRFLGYRFGTNLVSHVVKAGKLIVDQK
jgi:imidazolonepropionase